MSLPSSGTITMGMIRDELKKTGAISLGSNECRQLAGKPSGTIKMSDFYGKSNRPEIDITVNIFIKLDEDIDPDDPGYFYLDIDLSEPKPTEKIMGGTIGEFNYYGDLWNGDFNIELINCTEFFPPKWDDSPDIPAEVGIICHYPNGTSDELELEIQDKVRKYIYFVNRDIIPRDCNFYKYAKSKGIGVNGGYVQVRLETFYK